MGTVSLGSSNTEDRDQAAPFWICTVCSGTLVYLGSIQHFKFNTLI